MTDDTTAETPEPNDTPTTYGDPVTPGFLLDPATDPKRICTHLHDEWTAQRDKYAKPIKEAEVNRRRRSGEGNVWVEKVPDSNQYRIYAPHGATKDSQWYQKADRLCHRLIAVLHPDPPEPEAVPQTGEDADRDAAEFTTRVLKDVGGESGLNDLEAHKAAFDLASNGGAAYIWYKTDPHGGGRQPIEIDAHPLAPHVDQAMIDPETGGQATQTVRRFVGQDGTLSDQAGQAAKRWVPKLAREVVSFDKVRLLPQTATDIWDASGLIYADYHPWGTLKGWFDGLAEVSDVDRDHAIRYRLKDCEHLLPRKGHKVNDQPPKAGHEDDGLALLMIKWCVEATDYPEGAYVVTVGDQLVPYRGPWMLETPDGLSERRDLPFTQVIQFRSDGLWKGLMHYLGPSNENRGEITGRMLDMLDKILHPKTGLPMGSTIQPEDLDDPFTDILYFQPGYEPKPFEGPKIPAEAFKLLEMTTADMNDATGMGQASAEGLEAPNVQSGRHALAIQSSQQANLADLNQNVNRAHVRAWRIQLQCLKADYDVPQLLRFIDKDGDYKVQRWLGSELGSVRDVQIKRGTGTLFNPAQKAQYVAEYAQISGTPAEDVRELLATGYSPYVQLQDNAQLMRIRRQIAQWEKGPPEGWMPPNPEPTVQGADPMTGEPILGPPAPPAPDPIFEADARPNDTIPKTAAIRIRELDDAMAGTRYGKFDPAWRDVLNREFGRMQAALMPPAQPMPAGGPPAPGGKAAPSPDGGPSLTPMEQAVLGPSVDQPAGAVAP